MKRNLWRYPALALLGVLCACPQKGAVWIAPGSSADRLVIGVGRTPQGEPHAHFNGLRVEPCASDGAGEGAAWVLSPAGETREVGAVTYGEVPPGYKSDQGPAPLATGCYRVHSLNGGTAEFTVTASRQVVPQ